MILIRIICCRCTKAYDDVPFSAETFSADHFADLLSTGGWHALVKMSGSNTILRSVCPKCWEEINSGRG